MQAVFKDHFEELKSLHPRDIEIKEVSKMIECQRQENGTYYVCPCCNYQKYVTFTCKSRFCPSCGSLINIKRCTTMSEAMLDVLHRQWVFTIPASMRHLFKNNWKLIDDIFNAGVDTIRHYTKCIKPYFDVEPGIIGVLHTFGRSDEEFEPHIHFIVTCGGINKFGKWFSITYSPYNEINIYYRDRLLYYLCLPSHLGSRFRSEAEALKQKYPNGFVVNLKPPDDNLKDDPKKIVKYIARYISRPCIASSRILSYDGKEVTYEYTPHDTNQKTTRTISAIKFITILTQHIPEENYRVVRYYGIYCKSNHENMERLNQLLEHGDIQMLYLPENKNYREFFKSWRGAMIKTFKVDPIQCPECAKAEMIPLWSRYKGKTYYAPNTYPKSQMRPPKPIKRPTSPPK